MGLNLKNTFTLKTLTPLHIGSGETYQPNLDYRIEGGHFSLINRNRLFTLLEDQDAGVTQDIATAIEANRLIQELQAKKLLEKVLSYKRPIFIAGKEEPVNFRAQIKDGNGRPLLPGSTLKGAIRTAIIGHLTQASSNKQELEGNLQHLRDIKDVDNFDPKFADQKYLEHLLGSDPNHNLMRTLSCPDLYFDRGTLTPVAIKTTRLIGNGKKFAEKGFTMGAEAIGAGAETMGSIILDGWLQNEERRRVLGYQDNFSCTDLLAWIREKTQLAIDFELTFLSGKTGDYVADLLDFYRQKKSQLAELKPNQAIFNLAWGIGWRGMTGPLIGDIELDEQNYRLREVLKLSVRYAGSFPFPKSRRVVLTKDSCQPMGWVLLTLCEESDYQRFIKKSNKKLDEECQVIGAGRQKVLEQREDERRQAAAKKEKLLAEQCNREAERLAHEEAERKKRIAEEQRRAAMSPLERGMLEVIEADPDPNKRPGIKLLAALKQGRWQGEDGHIVAEKIKDEMVSSKKWKETTEKKNPTNDHDYQKTLEVLKFLQG